MATQGAPCDNGSEQDGLKRDSVRPEEAAISATGADESLPPLLEIISTGDYSFMDCASPVADAHAAIDIPYAGYNDTVARRDGEECGIELIKDEGSFSLDNSFFNELELSMEDVLKPASAKMYASNPSTPKSDRILTPRPILSKRGGFLPMNRGAWTTPRGLQAELAKKVSFLSRLRNSDPNPSHDQAIAPDKSPEELNSKMKPDAAKKASKRKCFSQPMPSTEKLASIMRKKGSTYSGPVRICATSKARNDSAKQENYVIFRTRSAKLDGRQLSGRQSRHSGRDHLLSYGSSLPGSETHLGRPVPARRYFDALMGAELEFVKDSEELLLPLDEKWPFLLRFPIGCFGICLGLGSQAVLYKSLATVPSMSFLNIPLVVSFVLWCLSLTALLIISTIYGLKCLLYFEAVRREYYHPVRVNFFFAPWIGCMVLTLSVPPRIATHIHPATWCIFTTPLLLLKLKIYGQWLSGGQRRLSKVANPSTHLSLVGNFVSALLAATVGWDEPAMFFWAIGCAHYLVLFVTLYQRLPTSEVLPKELHPVFFLFVAAPSVASVAWKRIVGNFDRISRTAYFLGLFLYMSLVVRINFFRGFKFSITWWAYTFPMTASAIATIHYSLEVRHPITQVMAVVLSSISSITVLSVFAATIYHALKGSLLPNDVSIAITRRKHKREQHEQKHEESSDTQAKKCEDDSKIYLPSEGGTIVASLQNGLVSVTSEPSPLLAQHSGTAS